MVLRPLHMLLHGQLPALVLSLDIWFHCFRQCQTLRTLCLSISQLDVLGHMIHARPAILCHNLASAIMQEVLLAYLYVRSGSGSVSRKRLTVFAMTCGDVPAASFSVSILWCCPFSIKAIAGGQLQEKLLSTQQRWSPSREPA